MTDENTEYEYQEANMCFAMKHTTDFASGHDMDEMKAMLSAADPDAVKKVAQGWRSLHDDLVGSGGIKDTFDTAVAHVTQHWEGSAADRFAEQAQSLSKKLSSCAKYASHTSTSMEGAAVVLGKIKPEVMAMEKPSGFSSAMNSLGDGFSRSDDGLKKDLASGMGADQALDRNEDDLSAGKEAQLKMAAKMETLGAAYNSRAAEMGSWKSAGGRNHSDDYPGDPGGTPPAPVIVPTSPSPRSPRSTTSRTAGPAQSGKLAPSKPVASPRDAGITGGAQKPVAPKPQVGTAIDGVSGGPAGTSGTSGIGTLGGRGSVGAPGTVGGPGGTGGIVGALPGAAGALGGRAGAAASARGGVAGRPGAGGIGGGAGKAKGGAEARSGGLARQRGGVAGGVPKSGTTAGKGTSGGSGLHRSRGGAEGAGGKGRNSGAMGPGARNSRLRDGEHRDGERPDYLVEDEETWTPQTNVAPRVIE